MIQYPEEIRQQNIKRKLKKWETTGINKVKPEMVNSLIDMFHKAIKEKIA